MTTNPPHTAWKALHVPEHLPALLRDAFAAQQAAFAKNRYPSLQERRADLRALHRLLVDHRAALLDAVNADFGCRSHFETLATELLQGQEAALDAIRQLPRWMKKQKRHLDITQYPLASAYVLPQPVGVVGIVAPWNFPIAMVVQPLIGALAAGNRAMVKMSENSARTARLLQKLLPNYFPADKVCLFADDDAGPGQPLGPLFTQLPFNHLFFTGSPQTGRAVMANAAAHLTPVTLELGGKSPTIVAPDYPLAKAAERILWVKMLNAGQICTNVDYLFLPARAALPRFAQRRLHRHHRPAPVRPPAGHAGGRHCPGRAGRAAAARPARRPCAAHHAAGGALERARRHAGHAARDLWPAAAHPALPEQG